MNNEELEELRIKTMKYLNMFMIEVPPQDIIELISIIKETQAERDNFLDRLQSAESKLEEMNKQLKKIGALACTLDCMDEQESWSRQKIFDIVKEFTGVNVRELMDIAIVQSNADKEIEVPSEEIIRKTLDWMRCGIGANHSGDNFKERMEKYHKPMSGYLYAQLNNKLSKTVSK